MLKICDNAIVEPLSIIFNNCINQGIFPDIWKKSNICPIHKKGDKLSIITGQYHCYQFLEKYLRKTNYYQSISLAFGLMIHV